MLHHEQAANEGLGSGNEGYEFEQFVVLMDSYEDPDMEDLGISVGPIIRS